MNIFAVGQKITSPDKEYQILDPCPLGRGGFGITFKAKELNTEKICVIKQFKPLTTSTDVWRKGLELFNREAEKLKKLQHNQIPKLIEYFDQEGEYYLVQEYIEGHDLTEEITQGIKDEVYVIRLLEDILEVLSFLHEKRLIHRDLKPSNIRRRKNDNKIVLIDFGSVKEAISESQIQNNNQHPHTGVYSPGYSPVEQKEGESHFSSDIYAVGVIAIEALTGEPFNSAIFVHPSPGNMGLGNQSNETLDWHRYAEKVSQPLSHIIDKMVMTNHRKRYQSAQEALEAIRSIRPQSSTPPTARNPNDDYTLVRPNPGNPTDRKIVVISGIVSVLTVAILLKFLIPKVATVTTDSVDLTESPTVIPTSEVTPSPITTSSNNAEFYFNRAYKLYDSGDKQGAIDDYNQAININPNYANAYYNRGLAHNDLGDKQGAINDYTQAININPNYADAYYNRGIVRSDLGDKQGAIDDYNQAININPNYGNAYYNRGLARSQLGDKQAGIGDFQTAAQLYQQQGNLQWYKNALNRISELR